MRSISLPVGALPLLACGSLAVADRSTAEVADDSAFFESHVRPVLAAHCFECHSENSEKVKGGLLLDSRAGFERGGDSGPVVVPGKPDESLLIRAVRFVEESLEMPPSGKLGPREQAILEDWVAMGAPWPRHDRATVLEDEGFDFARFRREHWSFQPIERPPAPAPVSDPWVTNPVDAFVRAGLEKAGLAPSPPEESSRLFRRLALDVTGLLPAPGDVERFTRSGRPEAFERAVDRLLASPQHGERWGRHWLDVARYSDGLGGFLDRKALPHAWRYRDWVVGALNRDLSYDEFIRHQVAGDLIDEGDSRIAPGFFAVGPTYVSDGGDPEAQAQARAETLADRIDTVSRAFLGLTVACARCHDHKFDPITIEDYYALAGIFDSSREADLPLAPEPVVRRYAEARQAIKDADKAVKDFVNEAAKRAGVKPGEVEFAPGEQAKVDALRSAHEKARRALPPMYPVAHSLQDSGDRHMHVAIRGDLRRKGPLAPRRFLQILGGEERPVYEGGSGRRQLAEALVAADNPLTARVIANRIWLGHFGRGLVRSPSNFGILGEEPTHPGLLDRLAADLIDSGWSLRRLHRQLLLSSTWRMSSLHREEAFAIDGDNRLLWRMNPRRLDVEAWRDNLLAATGELDLQIGGAPTETILESRRRTLYATISRNGDRFASDEFLRMFDFPAPRSSAAQRAISTVPQQYLFILNSPFIQDRAKALAARLRRLESSPGARVEAAYRLLFGRTPGPEERRLGLDYLAAGSPAGGDGPAPLDLYCQVLLGSHEFMQIR